MLPNAPISARKHPDPGHHRQIDDDPAQQIMARAGRRDVHTPVVPARSRFVKWQSAGLLDFFAQGRFPFGAAALAGQWRGGILDRQETNRLRGDPP